MKTYLRVKLRTDSPADLLETLEAAGLSPLNYIYLPESRLFVLSYPGEGVHERLRALSRALPRAEFEETELAEGPEPGPRRFSVGPLRFFSPLFSEEPAPGEIYLWADLSFGSGRHPTTLLCLRALVDLFETRPPEKVFDLGCGSGILALAAARLGARGVLAADLDPRACREARHNVERNDLSDRILVVQGSLAAARPGGFDLVLANLTIGTLLALAPGIPRVLRPEGVAVLSGFAEAQKEEVLQRLPEATIVSAKALEGWQALVLRF